MKFFGKDKLKNIPLALKQENKRLSRLDYILLSLLIVVYGLLTFINLGTLCFPQRAYSTAESTDIVLDFGQEVYIKEAWVNPNISEGQLLFSGDDGSVAGYELAFDNMFRWDKTNIDIATRHIKIDASSSSSHGVCVNEIAFFDSFGKQLPVTQISGEMGLVDEQATVPSEPSYFNGMYFDELYHARTAYENIHNMSIYEWTHPPLGKLIISLGIRIFGMTPFGWRFMGALFGVLMIPVLYVFAKRIFKRSDWAFVAAALFSFDCMHFAQTRIATIDTFGVFFILLMYLFMYEYITQDHNSVPFFKSLIPLGLCGLSFGLGISSKWIGFYAAAGLAVLLFSFWLRRAVELVKAASKSKLSALNICYFAYLPMIVGLVLVAISVSKNVGGAWYNWLLQSKVLAIFLFSICLAIGASIIYRQRNARLGEQAQRLNNHMMILPWCCLLFILIPALIYFASYQPYFAYDASNAQSYGLSDAMTTLWHNQTSMFSYHSRLDATHPSSTMWFEWPYIIKSTWFYCSSGDGMISNISTTGNLFVWTGGFIGFLVLLLSVAVGNLGTVSKPKKLRLANEKPAEDGFIRMGCAALLITYVLFLIVYVRSSKGVVPTGLFALMIAITAILLALSKENTIKTLCIAIMANYLPWALVSRCVFIYHYFATMPFVLLAALLFLYRCEKKNPKLGIAKWVWLGLGLLYFAFMLPAISGIPTTEGYANFIEYILPGGNIYHGRI